MVGQISRSNDIKISVTVMSSNTSVFIQVNSKSIHALNYNYILVKIFFFFSFYGALAHFRAMASPISFLQPSLFLAAAFQLRIWSISTASLRTRCCHLPPDFPTDLLPPKHPPTTFLGMRESSILNT